MTLDCKKRFLILYGTQTGQAKAIAEEICEKSQKLGFTPDIFNLEVTEKKFNIEKERCVVFITSTTGDGDPPDTAAKFFRRLKKKTLANDYLSHLNYALLGLGDSNYSSFCNAGKTLDRRLEDLGAVRFMPSDWADDAVGLEVCVEPWMEKLFRALGTFHNHPVNMSLLQSDLPAPSPLTSVPDTVDTIDTVAMVTETAAPTENDKTKQTKDNKVPEPGDDRKPNAGDHGDSGPGDITSEDNSTEDTQTKMAASQGLMGSLGTSLPPLSEAALTLPALSPPFLQMEFSDETVQKNSAPCLQQHTAPWPSSDGPVVVATVTSACVMTHPEAVKKTLNLKFHIDDKDRFDYLPGDSVSVICHNDEDEVQSLLQRLGVMTQAYQHYTLSIMTDTKKKKAAVPPHCFLESSLWQLFVHCIDIREPPKKALIRVLAEHTTDPKEKRRLQELCSKQGAEDYSKYVRESSVSILDVLMTFTSCHPPVTRLIEHLPRLQPRPYSLCSSQLHSTNDLEIAFNVVEVPAGQGRSRPRQGVCTGMLDRLTKRMQTSVWADEDAGIADGVQTLSLEPIQVALFKRTSQSFHIPEDPSFPMILVGPGTGVAPFVGFLRHRQKQKQVAETGAPFGDIWLFYGCRHRDKDFLYRKEMEEFEADGTLSKLHVCFSRDVSDSDSPRYVQDNIRKHASGVMTMLDQPECRVFVCGDANHMARDVNDAFIQVLCEAPGYTEEEAKKRITKMRMYKKYTEDVWS